MKKISTSWITQWGKDYLYHLKEIFQGKINADNAGNKIEIENGVISHEEQYVRQTGNASSETLNFGDEFNVVTKSYGYDSYGHVTSQSTNTKTYKLPNSPTIPSVNDGILTIQQNGTTVETFSANQNDNKIANITVPTNTSDLTNDSGFITSTVNNLANYYLKTETYTQTEVNNLISQAVSGAFVVVNTLPTASADTMNKIYLVPKSSGSGSNLKDEYITVNNNGTYSWELIGDTAVDLTGYVKSIVVNGGTYTVASGTTTITLPDYYTESEIDTLIADFVESNTLDRVEYVQSTPSTYEADTLYVVDDGSDTHVLATIATTGALSDAVEDSTHRTVTDGKIAEWNGKADASNVYTKTQTDTLLSAKANSSSVYTKTETDGLLDDKVDKVAGKGLSTNDFDNAYKTKLDGIASGAEVNVQSDWDETDNTSDAYIQNKPSNIVSDASYVHTDNNYTTAEKNKLSDIESGAEANVQSDWNQSDNTADDFIKNKPSIPTALSDLTDDSTHRLVSDTEKSTWNNKSDFSGSYNDLTDKPTIPDELADLTSDSTHRTVTDSQISTWNNKSDFSGSYTDLTNKPSIPTATSDLTNDSGFISTETDPTVPAWAKASTKPSYNYSEIQNTPTIPDELADLTDDTTHRLVTDTEKSTWNGKQNALTFDNTPTDGSTNPVTSDGIYDALSGKADASDLSDYMTKVNPTGSGALSINRKANTTVGNNSVAIGSRCEASGGNAFACGVDSVASGDNAHAEGVRVTASGGHSHAEGIETTASAYSAHAEGNGTTASNRYAHAEGDCSIASGYGSHAEGYYSSTNNKYYAHVEGYYTTAGRDSQSVCGQYNSLSTDAMFIVGNGVSNSAKSNALEVLSDGRVTVGANPTGSMDAVPKGYLESKFIMISETDYNALTSYESNATYYVY